MYLKKSIILLLMNLLLPVNLIVSGNMKNPALDFSKIDMNALKEEVKHVEEYLKTMSPEERKRLEEEVMREVEKLSEEDIQQIVDLSQKMVQPEVPELPSPVASPVQMQPAIPSSTFPKEEKASQSLIQEIKKILNSIITKIDSIIAKITSLHRVSSDPLDERLWGIHKPNLEKTGSLVGRLLTHPINQDHYISQLTKDEAKHIRDNLKLLHKTLSQHEPLIEVPDVMGLKQPLSKESKNSQQINPMTQKRSQQAIKKLLDELSALSLTALNNQVEKFLASGKSTTNMVETKKPEPFKPMIPESASVKKPHSSFTTSSGSQPSIPMPTMKAQDGELSGLEKITDPLDQADTIIKNNKILTQVIQSQKPDELLKDIDSVTLSALEQAREEARLSLKALKSLSNISMAHYTNLGNKINQSSLIQLNTHLKNALEKIGTTAPHYALMKRATQTFDDITQAYRLLAPQKAEVKTNDKSAVSVR